VLTEIYIEALLADEALTDTVWTILNQDTIDDELAAIAWMLIATLSTS
jgi:hypothetical protein